MPESNLRRFSDIVVLKIARNWVDPIDFVGEGGVQLSPFIQSEQFDNSRFVPMLALTIIERLIVFPFSVRSRRKTLMPVRLRYRCNNCGYRFEESVLTPDEQREVVLERRPTSRIACPECHRTDVRKGWE